MKIKKYLELAKGYEININLLQCKLNNLNNTLKFYEMSGKKYLYKTTQNQIVSCENEISFYISQFNEIENLILSLDDNLLREVLYKRYILHNNWSTTYNDITNTYAKGIAEELGYSQSHIFRLHNKALASLKMIVNVS